MRQFNHRKRSAGGCICCASTSLKANPTVVSPFLADRAWGGPPELTSILQCLDCGSRFFDRGLSPEEAERYYRDFDSEDYFRARNRVELFYTREIFEATRRWALAPVRHVALRRALGVAGAPCSFTTALDFGGATGFMLLGIEARMKAVFDLCGKTTEAGIHSITSQDELRGGWELILNCQVLEHASDPLQQLSDLFEMISTDGWLYVEVPNQQWKDMNVTQKVQDTWLEWLLRHKRLMLAADMISTGLRVKAGLVPPLGFVPVREHLNFFTVKGLSALLSRSGFEVKWSGINLNGCVCAVGARR